MPQGEKSSYTAKQKRQAEHIEADCGKKGLSTKIAEDFSLVCVTVIPLKHVEYQLVVRIEAFILRCRFCNQFS